MKIIQLIPGELGDICCCLRDTIQTGAAAADYHFFSYDLDLDPMTLILKLDLDMVKMYLHTKNEVSMSRGSKEQTETQKDRKTHRQTDMTENITYPHTRVVTMLVSLELLQPR